MKKIISAFVIFTIIGVSCESDNKNITVKLTGTYTGTFQRQLAFGGGEISNVSITFSDNTWTGQSDRQKYPALCHGTFSLEKGEITFNNECIWTAEFDWSLILGGTYEYTLTGNQLLITKGYSGPSTDAWTDKYILTKQE